MTPQQQQQIILNRMVATQQAVDGYTDDQLKFVQESYRAAIKNTAEKLASDRRFRSRRMLSKKREEALLAELQIAEEAISDKIAGNIATAYADVGIYSKNQIEAITSWDGKTPGFNNVSISPQELEALALSQEFEGKVLQDWVTADIKGLSGGVKADLAAGRLAGEGVKEIAKRLYDHGVGGRTLQQMEGTVRTYMQSAGSYAREQVYEANADIIKFVKWSAVMENANFATGRGTCVRCIARDGYKYKLHEPRPPQPLHFK